MAMGRMVETTPIVSANWFRLTSQLWCIIRLVMRSVARAGATTCCCKFEDGMAVWSFQNTYDQPWTLKFSSINKNGNTTLQLRKQFHMNNMVMPNASLVSVPNLKLAHLPDCDKWLLCFFPSCCFSHILWLIFCWLESTQSSIRIVTLRMNPWRKWMVCGNWRDKCEWFGEP